MSERIRQIEELEAEIHERIRKAEWAARDNQRMLLEEDMERLRESLRQAIRERNEARLATESARETVRKQTEKIFSLRVDRDGLLSQVAGTTSFGELTAWGLLREWVDADNRDREELRERTVAMLNIAAPSA